MVHLFFFFKEEAGIRDDRVTGVQTCAFPILETHRHLDEALEEVTGGTADPHPQVFQGVMALEEVAGVELGYPLLEAQALLLAEPRFRRAALHARAYRRGRAAGAAARPRPRRG